MPSVVLGMACSVCGGGVVVVSRHGRGGLCGEVTGTSMVDKA